MIRSWGGNRRVMLIGTATPQAPLAAGDYSMFLSLQPDLFGVDVPIVRTARLYRVPDGMIPPGMTADNLLSSGLDLSPSGIDRFISQNKET